MKMDHDIKCIISVLGKIGFIVLTIIICTHTHGACTLLCCQVQLDNHKSSGHKLHKLQYFIYCTVHATTTCGKFRLNCNNSISD